MLIHEDVVYNNYWDCKKKLSPVTVTDHVKILLTRRSHVKVASIDLDAQRNLGHNLIYKGFNAIRSKVRREMYGSTISILHAQSM